MDIIAGAPSSINSAPPRPPSSSPFPGREDCWTEDATFTLIDAWGEHYLDLNRGNLRQKHWQEVADAVNDLHAAGKNNKKSRRTDVQCKNRIDTLKKKYKIEKARVSDSNGGYQSPWQFFSLLDGLIGDTFPIKKHSPPATARTTVTAVKSPPRPPPTLPSWTVSHPVGPRSGTQKRPAQMNRDDASFRRNFSAFAAVAAAAANAESGKSEEWKSSSETGSSKKRKESDQVVEFGYKELAQAIERFGEVYERVEAAKQRQMVELEKQRMQFTKDLEYQRMQLFMETQVQLQKIKRTKRASRSDSFS